MRRLMMVRPSGPRELRLAFGLVVLLACELVGLLV